MRRCLSSISRGKSEPPSLERHPPLEIRLHSPLTGVLKSEALLFTLRHPVVVGLVVRIGLVTDTLHSNCGHPGLYPVRNAG